jgi:glycosyltransferase involved in cell wall biosynthesis
MKISGGNRALVYPVSTELPLVSIIIVTYNAGKYLQQCMQAIKAQVFQNIEVLIFDGDSTDDTIRIIQEYENDVTYWQSEKDKGIYDAMNKAVKYATGQWVIFLGADDKLLEGFSAIAAFLKNKSCIYYGDFIADGKRHGGKFNAYRLAKSNLCHQNILYSRKVFDKYQYRLEYTISADHYLNMQCWADKDFSFEYHPLAIANFSKEGISSRQVDMLVEADRIDNIKKLLGYPVFIRYAMRLVKLKIKKIFSGK